MGILDGKTAVVTGGNRGIGRGIAERLSAEGGTVVLTSRTAASAEAAAKEIGPRAIGIECDVRSRIRSRGSSPRSRSAPADATC
jgi:NAD(P)-dependent dehydrogenase (short-subunit alcohol dehydrogenase family)